MVKKGNEEFDKKLKEIKQKKKVISDQKTKVLTKEEIDFQKKFLIFKAYEDYNEGRYTIIEDIQLNISAKEKKIDSLFQTYCRKLNAIWDLFGTKDEETEEETDNKKKVYVPKYHKMLN